MDIGRGMNTRIAEADRIKTLNGSVLAGSSDERDMIAIPPVNDDGHEGSQLVSRAQLVRIVRPRVEEILEMVRDRLRASPFAAEPRGRVILTGGACQLNGLVELATQILGLQGCEFVVANTDAQALTSSKAQHIIQMGVQVTEGLGAGSQPEVGRAAADEVLDEIRSHLQGSHMVFVTAGMGGGTGTGAAPVIARCATE